MNEEAVANELVTSVTGIESDTPVLEVSDSIDPVQNKEIKLGGDADFVPLTFKKVILTNEMMNDARALFPDERRKKLAAGDMSFPKTAGGFLANDLVDTFRFEFKDRIVEDPDYLTYEGLKNGTATILNEIPIYRNKPAKSRALTDDDIAKIFSNAEDANLAGAFFSELAKTAPALLAGMEAASVTGSALFSIPPVTGPLAPFVAAGKTLATVASGFGAGYAIYTAADEIEESIYGPDSVVVPGQRDAYEAYRTLGGGIAGVLFPFMLGRYAIDSGARTVLNNLGDNAQGKFALRLQASLDDMLTQTGKIARQSRAGAAATAAAEVAGASGSAVGAYFAESNNMGTGGRLAMEFLGGNVGAISLVKALPKVMQIYDQIGGVDGVAEVAGNAQQREWFKKINNIYKDYSTEDEYDALLENLTSPEMVALRAEAFPEVDFTAAQISGDPILMALEGGRAAQSSALDSARVQAGKKATKFMTNYIAALQAEGSDTSIKQAATLRLNLFEESIESSIQIPLNRLLSAVDQLKKLPGQEAAGVSQAELSTKMFEVIRTQIFDVTAKKERALYATAGARTHTVYEPNSGEIPSFLKVWDELSYANPGTQKAFEDAAPDVAQFIRDARTSLGLEDAADTETLAPITAQQVDQIRSRALSFAREYTSGLQPSKSDFGRKLGQFANSLRLGLMEAEDGAPEAYLNAVAFTRAKHDVVSRMVGNNKLSRSARSGAQMVDPEVTLQEYIKGNASVTLLRTRQLQALAKFADDQDLKAYADDVVPTPEDGQLSLDFNKLDQDSVFTTVSNLAESYLRQRDVRNVYKEVFDADTNQTKMVVDDAKLVSWREDNDDLLKMFPQLELDTKDAVTFQRSLEFAESRKPRLDKLKEQQTELGQLMNGRSPTVAIGEAFDSADPKQAFTRVFKLMSMADDGSVRVGGSSSARTVRAEKIANAAIPFDELQAGFKSALMQQALMRSGGEGGTFDPKTFHAFMFRPSKKMPKNTVAELALQNKVFTKGEYDRLKFMSTQMLRMQAADMSGKLNDPRFAQEAGAMLDFYYGITGSVIGTTAYDATRGIIGATGSSPGQLSAASAGQKYIKNIFQNVPALQKLDVLDQVFLNAELTSKLMKNPSSADGVERNRGVVGDFLKTLLFKKGTEMLPYVGRELFEDTDNTSDALYLGAPGIPESAERNLEKYRSRIKENRLPIGDQSSLQPPLNEALPPVRQATVPNGVQTATAPVDPVGTTGIASLGGTSSIDVDKARKLFPNDITFAARGGVISSGIGAFR
tara:strand:- start:626 stop:4456 length:3831 start_codon:yes stop_codon:yes gene_type:complete